MGHENRSETARIVEALVYNHVKRLNPRALVGIFSKERCRELERDDHHYNSKSFPRMLRFYHKMVPRKTTTIYQETVDPKRSSEKIPAIRARIRENQVKPTEQEVPEEPKRELPLKRKAIHPETAESKRCQKVQKKRMKIQEDQLKPVEQALEEPKRELFGHQKFCQLKNLKTATDLALFSHFSYKNQDDVLKELFSQEERERYRSLDESINVPTIKRMLLFAKIEKLMTQNRVYKPIWKCQLCKVSIKGTISQRLPHIGLHEDLPCYCFIEDCDKYAKTHTSLMKHLQNSHNLMVPDMNSHQYHCLREIKENYLLEARKYLDRYFPPESFVGLCDRKTMKNAQFEDPKCRKCSEIVKAVTSRRDHISRHISAFFECAIAGCNFMASTSTISHHLKVGGLLVVLCFDGYRELTRKI
ncbi:hypothetical protein L596_010077 [Steinernema carpocapsae]|uniref:Uncharacterized protein n=1 Tax=Steinernema carpocapsae TaxID=34508 RepID=A0A4U5PI16_STECR|nr:hypothetical protein L596_010077 [Steinernema carpocapsae]